MRVLGAQHVVPLFLHLNKSVISAFRKHVKLNSPTIHDPGHSSRGSGIGVVVGAGASVVGGGGGGRRCTGGFGATLVLSQQINPGLQFDVRRIKSDGFSQNASIILSKQNPGHLGAGGGVTGRGDVLTYFSSSLGPSPSVQQVPSLGQYASESTSEQNRANIPLTQSPSQTFPAGR
jgi:hypothetical protein